MIEIVSQYFSPVIPLQAWICLGVAFVAALIILTAFRGRLSRIRRRVTADDEAPIPVDGYPSVSVVIYSQADGENLRTLIPQIFSQDYPAPHEVIVVNDQKADETADIISQLELRYQNLYMTFAPENSRNLSRKKLSITLGLKAARHEVALLTQGNSRIQSSLWLRLMMRHFTEGKDVVLGWSQMAEAPDEDNMADDVSPVKLSRLDSFDCQWSAVRWLGEAVAGRPYRGDGCNLAYRRQLFFDNKGFSRSLDLNFGDDDIFINEIATRRNSAVELSPDAMVISVEPRPDYMYKVQRVRRVFTSRLLPRRPFLTMGFFTLSLWLLLVVSVLAAVLALPSLLGAVISFAIMLTALIPLMIAWRRTGRALSFGRSARLSLPLLMLWHPVYSFRCRMRARKVRRDQFTWGQKL